MALISFRRASDNSPFVIEEENILVGYDSTNGTTIEYINSQTHLRNKVEVADVVANIVAMSATLIALSFADYPTDDGFINTDRIYDIYDDANSDAVIIYNRGGAEKGRYVMTDSRALVLKAMYEKKGDFVYAAESYSGLTITLPAAVGNVTAKFTAGVVITIFGALDENNGTYIVASSAFPTTKTVITLSTTGVSDDTDTTGYVMVKG